jgi:hypothetical protein
MPARPSAAARCRDFGDRGRIYWPRDRSVRDVLLSTRPELGRQTVPCGEGSSASLCRINGEPGIYNFEAGAPGFITQQFSVTVEGDIGECGYTIFMTQRLSVALQTTT